MQPGYYPLRPFTRPWKYGESASWMRVLVLHHGSSKPDKHPPTHTRDPPGGSHEGCSGSTTPSHTPLTQLLLDTGGVKGGGQGIGFYPAFPEKAGGCQRPRLASVCRGARMPRPRSWGETVDNRYRGHGNWSAEMLRHDYAKNL